MLGVEKHHGLCVLSKEHRSAKNKYALLGFVVGCENYYSADYMLYLYIGKIYKHKYQLLVTTIE